MTTVDTARNHKREVHYQAWRLCDTYSLNNLTLLGNVNLHRKLKQP